MDYLAKTQYLTITDNVSLPPEDFGGWSIVNTGDVIATVNGVELDPAGAIIGIDYTNLPPNIIWSESINIRFDANTTGTNPKLILTRIKYTEKPQ